MIEAAMIWNEPNNKSHWDLEADPNWEGFARMARLAGQAIAAEAPGLPRVLGGMSPIDPDFVRLLASYGVMDDVDAVAVHGFPLDWNHWMIDEWPAKIETIRAATHHPVWVSEVGVSTFGAEEVQEWGLRRTAELITGLAPAHPLVQPLRPARRLARDDAAQGGGGLVLLPAFPHGPARRERQPEARRAQLPAIRAGARHLPMVPFRGPSAR